MVNLDKQLEFISSIISGVKEPFVREQYLEEINRTNESLAKQNLIDEYNSKYPDIDENDGEIQYLEYDEVIEIIDPFTGEISYEFKYLDHFYKEKEIDIIDYDENTVMDIDQHIDDEKELTDEAKMLLSLNRVRPTLKLYLEDNFNFEPLEDLDQNQIYLQEYIQLIQPALKKLLANLQEVKFTEAEKYVSQNLELSDAMLRSYTLKKDLAKEAIESKDFSLFTVEAASRGITPEELANEILKVNKKWTTELGKLNDMIEGFRAGANKVIDKIDSLEMLDNVMNAFDIAFKLDASAKPEDIIALYEPFKEEK